MNELPPSKQNAMCLRDDEPGTMEFLTLVSGAYAWYAPLFVYCIRRAYGDKYGVRVCLRQDDTGPEMEAFWTKVACGLFDADIMSHIMPLDVSRQAHDEVPTNGYTTAAFRFLVDYFSSTEYAIITDVDILTMPEDPDPVRYHMMTLRRFGTLCYDNAQNGEHNGMPRATGTRDTWYPPWGLETSQSKE
jgi:hypothetical protein